MTARHLRNIERMAEARDRDVWRWPDPSPRSRALIDAYLTGTLFDWSYTPGDTTETGTGSPGAGPWLANGGSEGSVGLSGDSVSAEDECGEEVVPTTRERDAVLSLHRRAVGTTVDDDGRLVDWPHCELDREDWPCATAQALGVERREGS